MPKKLKNKKNIVIAIITLTIILLITIFGLYTVRRSWPQETGQIKINGLKETVEIRRDRAGVPHIYAKNQHDLFLAQGYIHAQDRFWQMDFWRHIGAGRLAEMFGASQLETDKFIRTLGWAKVAEQEYQILDHQTQENLAAYATGVNAYLLDKPNSSLSLEYAVLKFLNPAYKPEPWQPINSITWGKAMSYDLSFGMFDEIEKSVLLKTLTKEQIEELYPPYPDDHPVIVPDFKLPGLFPKKTFVDNQELLTNFGEKLDLIGSNLANLKTLTSNLGGGIGSNNWVVSGQHTKTGKPILANDPHLKVQMPSIWHELGLHCTIKSPNCPYNIVGFSFPGMAGIIIGHNDRIAWGITNVGPDTMDLYIEKINPENLNQYEVNGKWVDFQASSEKIKISDGKIIDQIVRSSRHGPIISDTFEAVQNFDQKSGIKFPEKYAIALRWTALEPSELAGSILEVNRAQNWQEFRQGLQKFDVPAQNFIYADIEGNIGYQMPGKIPIRNKGNGRYPNPGWIDDFEWKGYIPFEKLPFVLNPDSGYIFTANNAVVKSDYPYLISNDLHYGYRAERIRQMLTAKTNFTVTDFAKIQADSYNLNAANLVPILRSINLADQHLVKMRNLLNNWDFQGDQNSIEPTIFAAFWKHLLADTFHDNLPEKYWPIGLDRWFEIFKKIVKEPDNYWWDNIATKQIENRDEILAQAFAEAISELEEKLGTDTNQWRWGKLHTITFTNQTLGKSGISLIESLFNRGPFPASGSSEMINATDWDATKDYSVTWLPSLRMIVDLSNWDNSLGIHTTGESGHAFHRHYDDMMKPSLQIEFHPMLWSSNSVANNTENYLLFMP